MNFFSGTLSISLPLSRFYHWTSRFPLHLPLAPKTPYYSRQPSSSSSISPFQHICLILLLQNSGWDLSQLREPRVTSLASLMMECSATSTLMARPLVHFNGTFNIEKQVHFEASVLFRCTYLRGTKLKQRHVYRTSWISAIFDKSFLFTHPSSTGVDRFSDAVGTYLFGKQICMYGLKPREN